MRQEDKIIDSMAKLIETLAIDTASINTPIWFRGHSNKDWKLIPSIFRGGYGNEMDLIKKFKQDATLLLNPRPSESHDWLFIMRHHDFPTRLLDWTESPLVAMYFVVNKNPDVDGTLWVLLPLDLNKQENRQLPSPDTLPSFVEDRIMESYKPENFDGDRFSNMLPLAFLAPRNTPRMQSQLSVFTISHRDKRALEELGDTQHVWRYIIPKSSKEKIKKELELLRIGHFQLFPELDSIKHNLKRTV